MRKKIGLAIIGSLLLVSPLFASAQSVTDLQAQVQALLAQLGTLQQQLAGLQTTTPTSPPSPIPPPQGIICPSGWHANYSNNSCDSDSNGNGSGSCPVIVRALWRGLSGDDVRQLQLYLVSQGYLSDDNATGLFGSATQVALQQWQASVGLVSSGDPTTTGWGVFGDQSRIALARRCGGGGGSSSFSASPSSGSAPLDVTFFAQGNFTSSQIVIDYGDGQSKQGGTFATNCSVAQQCGGAHTYTTPGTYIATLYKPAPSCQSCNDLAGRTVIGTATITVTNSNTSGGTNISATASPVIAQNSVTQVVLHWDVTGAPSGAGLEIGIAGNALNASGDATLPYRNIMSIYQLDGTTGTLYASSQDWHTRSSVPSHGTFYWSPGFYEGYLPISGPVTFTVIDSQGNVLARTTAQLQIVSGSSNNQLALAFISGNQSSYTAGSRVHLVMHGTELYDNSVGAPQEGMNVQIGVTDSNGNGNYVSMNATYNSATGNWEADFNAPSDTSKTYRLRASFYCSNTTMPCASRYGTLPGNGNGQIDKSFNFTVTGGTGGGQSISISKLDGNIYSIGDPLSATVQITNAPQGAILCTILMRESDGGSFAFPPAGGRCPGVSAGTSNFPIYGSIISSNGYNITPGSYHLVATLSGSPTGDGKDGPSLAQVQSGSFRIVAAENNSSVPSCSITSNKLSVAQGEAFTLSWNSQNMPSTVMYQQVRGGGTVAVAPNGSMQWTAESGTGSDVFSLGFGGISAPFNPVCGVEVHLTNTASCQLPHITPLSTTIASPSRGFGLGFSADQSVTWSSPDLPSWASLSGNKVTIQQAPSQVGTYSFTIVAMNSCGGGDKKTVTIVIDNGTAQIDQSSLTSSSGTPTISGSGTAEAVGISISNNGGKVYGSGLVGNNGGRWSHTVTTNLPAGTYTVNVYNYFSNAPLTSGTLTIASASSGPTATLTHNGRTGQNSDTVNVGDKDNWSWSSTGGTSASSYFTIDKDDACGNKGGGYHNPWVISSLSGSLTSEGVYQCQAGRTYTLYYVVTDAQGRSATASVTVYVRPPVCTYAPSGAQASTITIEGGQDACKSWCSSQAAEDNVSYSCSFAGTQVAVANTQSTQLASVLTALQQLLSSIAAGIH